MKPFLDRFEGIGGANGTILATGDASNSNTTPEKPSTEERSFTEADISSIISLGFTRSEALEELKNCNGNVEQAKASLLSKAIKF